MWVVGLGVRKESREAAAAIVRLIGVAAIPAAAIFAATA